MAEVERTCVVCRRKGDLATLLRFVKVEDEIGKARVVADFERIMPGRGAYCQISSGCLHDKKLLSLIRRSLVPKGDKKTEVIWAEQNLLEEIKSDLNSVDDSETNAALRKIVFKEFSAVDGAKKNNLKIRL